MIFKAVFVIWSTSGALRFGRYLMISSIVPCVMQSSCVMRTFEIWLFMLVTLSRAVSNLGKIDLERFRLYHWPCVEDRLG